MRGQKPDEIITEDGTLVGFTDAGWAERIIHSHNQQIHADIPKERCTTWREAGLTTRALASKHLE